MLDLTKEEIIGWKLYDVLKNNEHLLNAYYKIDKKTKIEMSTYISGKGKERIGINFVCTVLNPLGNTFFYFQPISKLY